LATGLLPICFGEATKFSVGLLESDKTYRAQIKLGQTTTTGDAEGEIIATHDVTVKEAQVQQVLQAFRGEIQQLPPMHSALKHQGKPLYEYIRKGETIARELRNVVIHELVLEQFGGDELVISVRCSKGTYVRTLAEDIGKALVCGAHLTGLRRTAIANFTLDKAYSLSQLEAMTSAERDAVLLPLDCMLLELQRLDLDEVQVSRLAQGQRLGLDLPLMDGKLRLYAKDEFVGLGEFAGRRLSPSRLVASVAKRAAQSGEIVSQPDLHMYDNLKY